MNGARDLYKAAVLLFLETFLGATAILSAESIGLLSNTKWDAC